ncbi:hypothetical protein ABZZ79_27755 [Streptomyces sp. NPDC006458]|uniref:hypothetical protein n=1 Tax=Streptomyces sp. NPDC006458 TaxID=3154302 RepID=UPI0033B7D972
MARPIETAYGPLPAVAGWLRANGVDLCDVPIDADIVIEPMTLDGARCIRYTHLVREDGRIRYDPLRGGPEVTLGFAPLSVEPPENVHVRDLSKDQSDPPGSV